MQAPVHSFSTARPGKTLPRAVALALALSSSATLARAQAASPSPENAPATAPAGVDTAAPAPLPRYIDATPDVAPKARKEAEDAYLRGARALDHKDLEAAERDFQHANQLNPKNRDYAIALAVTREHRLTDLVQRAARAQKLGHTDEADKLLLDAKAIDPDNPVVRQHFNPDGTLAPYSAPTEDPFRAARAADANSLAGAIQLTPDAGKKSFHLRGGPQEILNAVCTAFGLRAQFDNSVSFGQTIRFDLDNASFDEASRTAEALTGTFFVPMEPKVAFFAKDTQENRAQFVPLVEETLFMPGTTQEAMAEYANVARNVFSLRSVSAVNPSGGLVLRGDAATIERVNATFSDLLDAGSDVLLDVRLYEVDTSRTRTIGAALPSSVGVFPIAAEAQSLINANQSLISAAIASNQITLTGNPATDAITELGLLLASGVVSSSQFSNLLGVFGHYNGLPLGGVFLGSSTTVSLLLNSSDIRILDDVQLRAEHGQEASFRAGTRYPIETGIYSSNLNNSLTAAAAGLSINGTSVNSLLSQYLGSTSVNVPQIQYEDLGLTLKAKPRVLRSADVALNLDLKIEALGSGTINTLPVLNDRQLTSDVTLRAGQTVLLASLVDRNELRSINGLPFLSELPGFQGTEKSTQTQSTELVITITPHIVRNRRMEVASRRLLMPWGNAQGQGGGAPEYQPQQFVPPPPPPPPPQTPTPLPGQTPQAPGSGTPPPQNPTLGSPLSPPTQPR